MTPSLLRSTGPLQGESCYILYISVKSVGFNPGLVQTLETVEPGMERSQNV